MALADTLEVMPSALAAQKENLRNIYKELIDAMRGAASVAACASMSMAAVLPAFMVMAAHGIRVIIQASL